MHSIGDRVRSIGIISRHHGWGKVLDTANECVTVEFSSGVIESFHWMMLTKNNTDTQNSQSLQR